LDVVEPKIKQLVLLSININKSSNPLSLQIINKTTTYNVENPGHCLGQAQTYGGVKPVNEIPTPPLDNWISNGK
jgi:hypothetical protein